MPNHCGNRWTIKGDKKERDQLVEFLETKGKDSPSTELDFNNIRPVSGCITVDTHIHHWGTKWNAYDIEFSHGDDTTVYTFLTAWCPPSKDMVLEAMARFPALTYEFLYAESGMMFYGRHGSTGPEYQCKFKWNKKEHGNKGDFVTLYDSDDEDEWEGELLPELAEFQGLYDMSG